MAQAQQALSIAREVDDPALLARALTAYGVIVAILRAEVAEPYFAEAIGLARALDDRWRLSQLLASQATAASYAGDPIATRAPAEEGRDLADAIGDRYGSRFCRWCLGTAQLYEGDLLGAAAQFGELVAEAQAAHDGFVEVCSLAGRSIVLACQGDTAAARAAAAAAIEGAAELGGIAAALGYSALAFAAQIDGDIATLRDAVEAWPDMSAVPQYATVQRNFKAMDAVARGDLVAARRWADEAVTNTSRLSPVGSAVGDAPSWQSRKGSSEEGARDARDALACAAEVGAYLPIPDILECLAGLAGDAGSHREAARLFGAAHAIRERRGAVRFKVGGAGYQAACRGGARRIGRERL